MNQDDRNKSYDLLDEDQKLVVTHEGGDAIVLAGAGSGKTRCMQHRVSWLLDSGVHPRRIVAISFTKKASDELRRRIIDLHPLGDQVISRTFHSLCLHILRTEGIASGTIESGMAHRFISSKFSEVGWKSEEPASYVLSAINAAKMRAIPESDFPAFWKETDPLHHNYIRKLYALYEAYKKENGLIDFSDMLYMMWKLMLDGGSVAQRVQNQFHHVIVDETQDLNPIQIAICDLWSKKHRNLMIVGDIRQSMYGFRGANVQDILQFSKDREMKVYYLLKNYRSGADIVHVTNDLISEGEIERGLPPCKPVKTTFGSVYAYSTFDQLHESDFVAKKVSALIESGVEPREISCLFRVNAQAQYLEMSFNQARIPYKVLGGVSFFDRKEIKDAVAYLHVARNLKDYRGVSRIYNTPSRYLGKAFWNSFEMEYERFVDSSDCPILDALDSVAMSMVEYRSRNVIHLAEDIRDLHDMYLNNSKPHEMLEYVYQIQSQVLKGRTFLDLYLAEDGSDTMRSENLDALLDLAKRFDSLDEFLNALAEQNIYSGDDDEDSDGSEPDSLNQVQMMTIHKAKGLEFKHVFIIGFSDGLFPHFRGDPDEERRVAYVAITRAEESVVMTCPMVVFGKPRLPSPYLSSIGVSPEIVDPEPDHHDLGPEPETEG